MRRHDPELIEHGKRTAAYSVVLGRALNLPDDDLADVSHAALLHDLGKLTLPNQVIQQNGLSMIGEYLMAECSPHAAAEILRPWPGLQHIATLIALHHERWDGHGQPFGMPGHLIPLGSRILSLADTVDQLLSQKDDPIPHQADIVVCIVRSLSGTRYDPRVVEAFADVCAPWIKNVGLQFAHEYGWPPAPRTSASTQTFTEFLMVRGGAMPITDMEGAAITSFFLDIGELTNPVSYDPTLTSI